MTMTLFATAAVLSLIALGIAKAKQPKKAKASTRK